MEHVNMAGICTEASIFALIEKAMPGRLKNVYAHPSGGGKYMAILQIEKMFPVTKEDSVRQHFLHLALFRN
jgi:4-hydroxy-3-polyprenylbenzoate decarboxylase